MRRHLHIIFVVAIMSILLTATAFAKGPKAKPFIPDIPKTWMEIVPGPTEYMGLELTPTCSGFPGTDPEYSFFVKGGTANNLVVYFQGGGACWDAATCILWGPYTPYSKEVRTTVEGLANAGGMFDTQNPDNPFKDWSYVYIPYCTGDIHWGSNDVEYVDGQYIHHRGLDNFLVVLEWITENIRSPHKIFVTGSSAGAYGAYGLSPWIKESYPKSKMYVLGDAGMGISPIEFQDYSRGNWNVQLPEWVLGEDTLGMSTPEIFKAITDYYPHTKFAAYTNAWDSVQIRFYDLILDTLDMDPLVNPCVDWNTEMLEGEDLKTESPNYRGYIAAGIDHTIMGSSRFYTEDSAGISFLEWLDAMVKSQGGTHGHGGVPWENFECIDCEPLDPCP